MATKRKCIPFARSLCQTRSVAAAAAAGHSFPGNIRSVRTSSTPPADSLKSDSSPRYLVRSEKFAEFKHPFKVQVGLKHLCELKEYPNEAVSRVVMPSVGRDVLKVWFEEGALYFEGQEQREEDWDDACIARLFYGIIDVPPGVYDTGHINASIKYGILKLVIPKLKPGDTHALKPIEFRDLVFGFCKEDGFTSAKSM